MEKNDNVIELKPKTTETTKSVELPNVTNKATNPIAKNFIKFVNSSKEKFSIKDIFR